MASISPLRTSKDKFSKSTRSDSPERKTFFKFSTRNTGSCEIRCNLRLLRYRGAVATGARAKWRRTLDAARLHDAIKTRGPRTAPKPIPNIGLYEANCIPVLEQ